ncbi:hypothetical protein GCM10010335_12400 [Streptomyces galbus]|nr:hypothetical protein GCM10010335_12400 [Streptomyces galbus]
MSGTASRPPIRCAVTRLDDGYPARYASYVLGIVRARCVRLFAGARKGEGHGRLSVMPYAVRTVTPGGSAGGTLSPTALCGGWETP